MTKEPRVAGGLPDSPERDPPESGARGAIDIAALPDVEVCETHGSKVYLSGSRAYKVRKAVKFPFLDQSTPDLRRKLAMAELALNRELAPGTYLGLRPVAGSAGNDVAVEMRRFRERDTLAARLSDGRVDEAQLTALGARIARFHAEAAPEPVERPAATAIRRLHGAADGWAASEHGVPDASSTWRTVLSLERQFVTRADDLRARAVAGRWREGHGDLRADHVVFDDHGLSIVDRLEFDRALRVNDVGDDLAFLLMDLRSRGGDDAARTVLAAYRNAGGDPGDDGLLSLWSAYRALVSLEVALLRQAQVGAPNSSHRVADLASLAARCVWEARGVPVVVVCGSPATGKSTLARELARRCDWPVVSSDVVRKDSLGLLPTEHAPVEGYSRARTRRVYADLARHACDAVQVHGGVIVDATMGDHEMRATFTGGLDALESAAVFVECRVPADVAERRAALRSTDPTAESDADAPIARRLAAAFQPLDEVAAARHLPCRADRGVAALADEVEARLDLISDER